MKYTNLELMITDLIVFAKNNANKKIVLNDSPMRLLFGFKDDISGEVWEIRLSDIKNSLSDASPALQEIANKMLISIENRQLFVDKLNDA